MLRRLVTPLTLLLGSTVLSWAGLLTDPNAIVPIAALAKPAYLGTVIPPTFGATIHRITGDPGATF